MKEEWLFPGAVVPVDVETTTALVVEIKRLIDVVGGMALQQQRTWVGLTDEEIEQMGLSNYIKVVRQVETKLKEKNNAM